MTTAPFPPAIWPKCSSTSARRRRAPRCWGTPSAAASPPAYDSWFAFEAGNLAVNLLRNGIGNQVIGIKDGRVYYMPIDMALQQKREFNLSLYNMINTL